MGGQISSGNLTQFNASMALSVIVFININHDNVYGAVAMTKVIARVHPVHFMNVG